MFCFSGFEQHESLHLFEDREHGLFVAIAIHSTALGPASGGCRIWEYPDSDALILDALALSRAMSYKSAIAELPLGGGKAVMHKPHNMPKTPEMFAALGRAIESLGGKYYVAEDVGVSPQDLAHTAGETGYICGLDHGPAASGDPSPVTAKGVFWGMQEAAKIVFGHSDLSKLTIAVQGVGGVGGALCEYLAEAGARLIITDINAELAKQISTASGASSVAPEEIYAVEADIFSPNALGGSINTDSLAQLKCKLIAGGANNQLADKSIGEKLLDKGIVYAPDYVINGGGIINLAGEIAGLHDPAEVEHKLQQLALRLGEILRQSAQSGKTPAQIADGMARANIEAARRR